jgi:peptide methionine sulfoxide reductase msrA/msrB
MKTEKAIFASGCFWGTEYFMKKHPAVISTKVGYMGGEKENPTYEEVYTGTTGHAEVVEVTFNADKSDFEDVTILFFETHDFTQIGGVGPDIGDQYRSEVFYLNENQKEIAESLISKLKEKSYSPSTKITKASKFWEAEKHHQDYYYRTGGNPYCHIYKKIF